MAMGAQGAGRITISDAEMVALTASLHTMEMSPGCTDLPRLAAHAKMYDRYRILSLRIEYVPTSGMATTGSVAVTLQPGPKNAAIKDEASVLKSAQPRVARLEGRQPESWATDRLTAVSI